MPGKLDVYAFGEAGVNVVDSVVHVATNQLRQAQNAQWNPIGEQKGLSLRPAMLPLNAVAMDGDILAIFPIPFTDPSPSFGFSGFVVRNNIWHTTANGDSWQPIAEPTGLDPDLFVGTYQHWAYFLEIDGPATGVDVKRWNGVTVETLHNEPFPVGSAVSVRGALVGDQLALFLRGDSDSSAKLFTVPDMTAGTVTTDFTADGTGAIWGGLNAAGQLFIMEAAAATPRIVRWDGAAWDVEYTSPDNTVPYSPLPYALGAQLAFLNEDIGNSNVRIVRRNGDGTWTAVHTGTGGFQFYAFDSTRIFAARQQTNDVEIWSSTDGSTWALDKDLTADFADAGTVQGMMMANGELFILTEAPVGPDQSQNIYRRSSGGVYTEVFDAAWTGGLEYIGAL